MRIYEQLTGKRLVMDNFVQGRVNSCRQRCVAREAIKIIEMSMSLNGISLVPFGRDGGRCGGPKSSEAPVQSFPIWRISPGNPVISFCSDCSMRTQELQQVLMAFQGSSGTINILALPKASALLVTQNADIIRQLSRH